MKIKNFINGQHLAPQGQQYLANVNPYTEDIYSQVPSSTAQDVELAIKAAKAAFPAWSKTPIEKRKEFLRKIAIEIQKRSHELALAESVDTGKPIQVSSSVDIPRAQQNFEFFSDLIVSFDNRASIMDDGSLNYTTRKPLGVVAVISPWNLPFYLLTWKLAPALITGNTVVAKPSEITPMTAYLLGQICSEVGLPPGVLNIVHGLGQSVGKHLVSHPEVKAISFTGSTQTGAQIANDTARTFKKLALEMGGKNSTVIFSDCQFDKTVTTTLKAAFSNQGQICLCGSKILIEKSIYQKFKDALVKKTLELKMGDPLEESTQMGTVVSLAHQQKIQSYLEYAKQQGATFLTGQQTNIPNKGYFVAPTLLEGLSANSKLNQEEIFGPVACLIPFDNDSEAIELVNCTRYGLAASIWTQDITRAHHVADQLHTGMVWINTWMKRDLTTPFGGVKDSGMGKEGGKWALDFFTETKNICVDLGDS